MIFENRSINERIIKIRKLRSFSQLELADKLNMPLEKYIELLEILAEAEDDVKNERVAPVSETFDELREMLQEG